MLILFAFFMTLGAFASEKKPAVVNSPPAQKAPTIKKADQDDEDENGDDDDEADDDDEIVASAPGANDSDDEDESEDAIVGNVTVASDYYLRGLSQTNHQPATQGGFDADLPHGFSLGTFGSNVHFTDVASSLELDFYGKYTYDFRKDLSASIGALYYSYWAGIGRNRWDFPFRTQWREFSLEVDFAPRWQAQDTRSWYVQAGWQKKVFWDLKLGVFAGHNFRADALGTSQYSDYMVSASRDFLDVTWGLAGVYVDKKIVDEFDGGFHGVFSVSKTF